MTTPSPRMVSHFYGDDCKPWGHLDPGQEESRKLGCTCPPLEKQPPASFGEWRVSKYCIIHDTTEAE